MKVRVVGSGNINSKCNSASYLIDDDIIVDCPNGMCKALIREGINPGNIKHALITHFHGDHYFDMPFLFLHKSKADNKELKVYCSKDGKSKIDKLLKLAFPNSCSDIKREMSLTYETHLDYTLNNYRVTKILVDHGRMKPSYGYIFSRNDLNVGFTGDTTLCKNVEYIASICNFVFIDCTFIKGTDKHMGIDMLYELSNKYQKCKFIVSHLDDETRAELLKLNMYNIIVPNDGDVVINY